DYEISLGKVTFNPGETSKTVRILIVDDNFVEGNEVVNLMLSNPTGAGVGLGSPNTATLTIIENDAVVSTANPVDTASFFVRQHSTHSWKLTRWLTSTTLSCGLNSPTSIQAL